MANRNLFVQFGDWSPDSLEFDTPELEVAKNVIPAYGSYRALERLQATVNGTDENDLNGGIAHLLSEAAPPLRFSPSGQSDTAWGDEAYANDYTKASDTDDYLASYVNSYAPDDTTYVYQMPGFNTLGFGWKFAVPKRTPVPAVTGDLTVRFRVRYRPDARLISSYTLSFVLYDYSGGGQQIGTEQDLVLTYPDGANEWYEHSWDVESTYFGDISDFNSLELRFTGWEATGSVTQTGLFAQYPSLTEDISVDGWSGVAQDGAGVPEADGEYTEDIYRFGEFYYGQDWVTNYIKTPAVGAGKERTAFFKFSPVQKPFIPVTGEDWLFLAFDATAEKANTNVNIKLVQPKSTGINEDIIPEDGFVTYGDSDYVLLGEVTGSDIQLIADPEDGGDAESFSDAIPVPSYLSELNLDAPFYAIVTVSYDGTGTAGQQYWSVPPAEPNGEYSAPSSGVTVNTDNLRSCSDGSQGSADGTAGITWAQNTGTRQAFIKLDTDAPQATAATGHKLYIRCKTSNASAYTACVVELNKNVSSTPVEVKRWQMTNVGESWGWKTFSLSENLAKQLDDYGDLGIRFQTVPDYGTLQIDEIFFEYPGDTSYAKIWNIVSANTEQYDQWPEISWVGMDALNPAESNVGDRTEIYVGNEQYLYKINSIDNEFENVTRTVAPEDTGSAADGSGRYTYGQTTTGADLEAEPRIWDFTTFGDKIIATNYVDEVQAKDVTDDVFSALIPDTSPYMPRARFAAVISSSLVLADINPTDYDAGSSSNYTDGKPFHLWASKPLDPAYFDTGDLANQTALFALVGQPGMITGLVGGEWGTVFKRNSIWRMTYAGLPQIFQIDSIAIASGCAYPESIVQVGQDIFFWGGGGISVVSNGSQLNRISNQRVEKAIFDTAFEGLALAQDYDNWPIANESRVYGAYDVYSGLIWWLYRGLEDEEQEMTRYLCYSTKENRFTHGQFDLHYLSLILGRMNVNTAERILNRGILGFDNSVNPRMVQFISSETYPAELKTKVLSSMMMGLPIGTDIEVQSVRPIFKSDPDTYSPNMAVTVEMSQDPSMQRGLVTRTVDSSRVDKDGFIPLGTPMQGEYARYTLHVPSLSNAQIKEILGLQVRVRAAGNY
jgi:hypothetical protein